MKRLIIALIVNTCAMQGLAQRGALGISVFSGYSGFAAYQQENDLKKWVKNNYGTFHSIFFIFGTTSVPSAEYTQEVKVPIGARIWLNTNDWFSIGFEYNTGQVLAKADFKTSLL